MNLKIKSLLVSGLLTVLFVLTTVVFVGTSIANKFQELENQRVERNLKIVDFSLEDRFKQLNNKISDWSSWDDTYQYIQDKNPEFEKSNFVPTTFLQMGVDEAIFIDSLGNVVAKFAADKKNSGLDNYFGPKSNLLIVDPKLGYGKGYLKTDRGLEMYVVKDILKSDGSGPSRGSVVFAKIVGSDIVTNLEGLTQFNVKLADWNDNNLGSDFEVAKTALNNSGDTYQQILNKDVNAGYLLIRDQFNKPQAIFRIDVIRDISAQGMSSLWVMIKVLIIFGIVSLVVNSSIINLLVIKKISNVSEEVSGLSVSGNLVKRLAKADGNDEVDKLRKKINQMLDSMQVAQIAIENSGKHIVMTDSEGKIIYANKTAEKMTGFSLAEMLGNTPRLWGRQMSQEFYKNLWQTIKFDKKVFQGEVVNKRKDGQLYDAFATITPVLDENGALKSFVAVEEDITEKKKIENEKSSTLERLKVLNRLMTGRELKMIELKNEIEKLKNENKN